LPEDIPATKPTPEPLFPIAGNIEGERRY